MGLTEALKKEYCFYPLEGYTKNEVLNDLIEKFSSAYGLSSSDTDKVKSAVLNREALCSTGLENGIAIPHAKLDFIDSTVVALGVSKNEIDFGSADGSPTKIYFLVLGNNENPSEHIIVLSQIAKLAKSTALLKAIRNAKSGEEIAELVL